ncbi:MAG: alpha-glucuronidase [Bacteroidales bacterium]|nr:alpha-glucuronidase [Bacteroidales bacterium]
MRGNWLIIVGLLLASACVRSNDSLWLDADIPLEGEPAYSLRILNHWDNLDDTVERGYADHSIWEWTSETLPAGRIAQYGALNAKIGINGIVLNNVNAAPAVLDQWHLDRVAAIADILRDYGIRVYLSVNFASPSALGGLPSADPLDPAVIAWWQEKVEEIYRKVPDFGGFLVKASSEGQPGPQDFGRTHADGANMLADALAPHGGIVMWRTFVYAADSPDRAMQAYDEFVPLDGAFRPNVSLQVKNGPIDFQPREPVSPLFGALRKTPMTPELQITMEYLGQSSALVFLGPMWEEVLRTQVRPGENVSSVTAGGPLTAIAGVANVGQDADWCGNLFNQANWYAFGRLAWDPSLSSAQIAEEWLRITFPKPALMSGKRFTAKFIEPMKEMMLTSREACVDYMMPLGLHHLFAWGHHFGPEPWCEIPGARPDWLPSYYHKADADGLGFDRTCSTGSGATAQYNEPLRSLYEDLSACPENLLLWFHHVDWDYRMAGGKTLWEELCSHYDRGVQQVRSYRKTWAGMKPYVTRERFQEVDALLESNEKEAVWWRDACLQYFAEFSRRPYPADIEQPVVPLDSLKRIHLDMEAHN